MEMHEKEMRDASVRNAVSRWRCMKPTDFVVEKIRETKTRRREAEVEAGGAMWTDGTVDGHGKILASGAMEKKVDEDDGEDGNSVETRDVERSGWSLGCDGTAFARRLDGVRRSTRL
ncbi:hypothetical protein PsorP6_005487 [Peronosclerospora sorghi]|uniref:Uncharacterized protein n=1 Tax=Peronosclerospora sorghi TaxID=230839 RepID=A0ACC0W3F0_9STRA|nr:hypothetical protein PsorP6_005487 [Peronosclerospora sorghi]